MPDFIEPDFDAARPGLLVDEIGDEADDDDGQGTDQEEKLVSVSWGILSRGLKPIYSRRIRPLRCGKWRSSVRRLPARVDPRFLVGRRQRRLAENVVGCLLADHDRRVRSDLPLVMRGKIEESATRSPSTCRSRGIRDSTTAPHVVGAAHAASAAGMVGAFGMVADMGHRVRRPMRTSAPGEISAPTKGSKAGWEKISRG